MSNLTQEERAIQLLRKAQGHGVANYTFANHRILRYSSVIKRLRADGYNILTEKVKLDNGRDTGVFRYTLIEDKKPSFLDLWLKKELE